MKLIHAFLWMAVACFDAKATQLSLVGIDSGAYESGTEKIKTAIADDNTEQEVLPFDKHQSFTLIDKKGKIIGHLVPVKFNSKSYRNTICRLFFLNVTGKTTYADLFTERNDGEDVVSSCVGVDAASLFENSSGDIYYLAVMRYRTINQYGSKGVVLKFNDGSLLEEGKINKCVASKGALTNVQALKKRLKSCM